MTEKKHDKATASTGDDLCGEPAGRSKPFDAYLAAILAPLGRENEVASHAGNIDYLDGAAVDQELYVEGDPLIGEASDVDLSGTEPVEKSLFELILLDCVEGKHEVSRYPLDSHVGGSFSSGGRPNRITSIAQSLVCGMAGATTALVLERLIG